MHVVMTAAHGGHDSEKVPLGGGAAVCERLCKAWAGREVTLIGSGPVAPPGVNYVRVGDLEGLPSSLGEFEYARFCRRFEEQATQAILAMQPRPVVLSHDISEGPSFSRLTRSGVDCLAILHVDVVDYFQRFYLGDVLPASWWTWLHSSLRYWPWPDVLKLVFEKQLQAALSCRYLVVPSEAMREILLRCYPQVRVEVVPWGSPMGPALASSLPWDLDERAPLLVTLSRIAPEKGQDLLLRALKVGEERGEIPAGLTLAIVGAPSYMMGQRYLAKLRKLAGQLRRVRVLFPGHLGGGEKQAVLERASLFVVCSRHESYGLTIMEAMAAGCPIVAVPSYGVAATVDESCARICAGDSPGALWDQISALLGDGKLRASLGAAAQARAEGCGFGEAADRLWKLCEGHHRKG